MKTPTESGEAGSTRLRTIRACTATLPPILDPRLWLALWIVTTGVTSILYLIPDAGPPGQMQLDKTAHFIAFGAIGWSAFLGSARGPVSAPMLVSLGLAAMLEWLQGFVPGREYSLIDCAANYIGLGGGIAAGVALRAWASRAA